MPLPQNPPTWTAVTTGSKEYSIELNDANLETKAWKLPRYEGCQTKTQVLNQKTAGDVTYGGPAAQKYSRNIYWGNGIIGMDDGGEDDSLLNFPQFSYVQTNTYFTVNDDDTITTNRLESRKDNFDERRGFYRAFYEDFPIGSDCKVIINDESIKSNLKDRYNVYFNQGQLQKLIRIAPPDTHYNEGNYFSDIQSDRALTTPFYNFAFLTGSPVINNVISTSSFGYLDGFDDFKPAGGFIADQSVTGHSPHDITIYNKFIFDDINYTGSFEGAGIAKKDLGDTIIFSHEKDVVQELFNHLSNERSKSSYKGDKRFFLTFCESGSDVPIRTIKKYNFPSDAIPYKTNNIAELSTGEVRDFTLNSYVVNELGPSNVQSNFPGGNLTKKFGFNFNYSVGYPGDITDLLANSYITSTILNVVGSDASPNINDKGRVFVTKLEDSNPSLLLNLPKNEHLKDGIGQRGFVILPENIHPHIKKNLTYYLFKAGVPLGIPLPPVPNNEFKQLK